MTKQSWISVIILASAILLIPLVGGFLYNQFGNETQAIAQGDTEGSIDTVTVHGSGTVSTDPDWSILRIGVETEADNVQTAQEEASATIANITSALKENDVHEQHIHTTDFQVRPNYHHHGSSTPTLDGFIVRHILHVEYGDIDQVGYLIDSATNAGANRVDHVQFTLQDDQDLEIEALQQAMEQARTKADALAKSAGKSVIDVHQIREDAAQINGHEYRSYALDTADDSAGTAITAGQVEVHKGVNVTYHIR